MVGRLHKISYTLSSKPINADSPVNAQLEQNTGPSLGGTPGSVGTTVPNGFGDRFAAVADNIATVLVGVQALRNIQFIEKPFDDKMVMDSALMGFKLDKIIEGIEKIPVNTYSPASFTTVDAPGPPAFLTP